MVALKKSALLGISVDPLPELSDGIKTEGIAKNVSQIYTAQVVDHAGLHLLVITVYKWLDGQMEARIFADKNGSRSYTLLYPEYQNQVRIRVGYNLACSQGYPMGIPSSSNDLTEPKWSDCMIDHIVEHNSYPWSGKAKWPYIQPASAQASACGAAYFGADPDKDTLTALLDFQRGYRAVCVEKRHQSARERTDAVMAQVGLLPWDMERWIDNVPLRHSRYLYYRRVTKTAAEGYCTVCRKDVIFKVADGAGHNEPGRCPRCGKRVTYKAKSRSTRVSDHAHFMIAQRVNGGILLRRFNVYRSFRDHYRKPEQECFEGERYIVSYKGDLQIYSWTDRYSPTLERGLGLNWYRSSFDPVYPVDHEEFLYTGNLRRIIRGTPWQYSCIDAFARVGSSFHVISYLEKFLKTPCVEYLMKLRLTNLVKEWLHGVHHISKGFNADGKNMREALGVGKETLPLLQKVNATSDELYLAIRAREIGKPVDASTLRWCRKHMGRAAGLLAELLAVTTAFKAIRFIEKNVTKGRDGIQIIHDWKDYYGFAAKLRYDLGNEAILLPDNLTLAHDRAMELVQVEENKEYDQAIADRAVQLEEQLGLRSDDFLIVVPKDVAEIIHEGQTLSHCVGRMNYIKNHAAGKTTILFIRRADCLEEPFYTMEVNNGHIVQVRGKKNCSATPDVQKFVDTFKSHMQKKKRNRKKPAAMPA